MKRLLIALAMFFSGTSAAMACSCIPVTNNPAELQRLIDDVARDAVALVEVDVRTGYSQRTRQGELMRVRRTLAGRAPRDFRIARGGPPSSAACDVEYRAGSSVLVLIYPVERRMVRGQPQYRDGSLCVSMFLHDARFRQMLVEAMRRRPRTSDASGSPAAPTCANDA